MSDGSHHSPSTGKAFLPLINEPLVKNPYVPTDTCGDIGPMSYAVQLFLNSHILEAEDFCRKGDPDGSRLYFSMGYGFIQMVKAMMTFADEDMLDAIRHTTHSVQTAQQHRKRAPWFTNIITGLITGTSSQHISFIESMTVSERHAELVYAECLFIKAALGLVHSGDWMSFIKEGLSMRTGFMIFSRLREFLDYTDSKAATQGQGPEDQTIDPHFRSGVLLGSGLCSIALSYMPERLKTLAELFGFHGDRHEGLKWLYRAGGWGHDNDETLIDADKEGIRRPFCDLSILFFNLSLSSITFDSQHIAISQKVLDWNLRRYPNGVLFLYYAGRLAYTRGEPRGAVEYYAKAMEAQSQYKNMHHGLTFEMALANLALWDIPAGLALWRELTADGRWSKAIYTYGTAVCLLELGQHKEACEMMAKVPTLRIKIAGKSIPLEKFVARKARKFQSQGQRLALPGLEFAYSFMSISHAPRNVVVSKMLPLVEDCLSRLRAYEDRPSDYESGHGYWDDYCLAKFFEGLCFRYAAHTDQNAVAVPGDTFSITKADAETRAIDAFNFVLAHGPKIELDHYIVYGTHFELGRLLACMGRREESRKHFELILTGDHLEVMPTSGKGKYSLQSSIHLRTRAALDALNKGEPKL